MEIEISIQTCFGMLKMEAFFILGKARLFALEVRSDPVEIEVVIAIIKIFAVNVAPVGADLGFLIESCAVRT